MNFSPECIRAAISKVKARRGEEISDEDRDSIFEHLDFDEICVLNAVCGSVVAPLWIREYVQGGRT